eukprot:2979039-Ditylum_brightwellii.AAC.1
MQATHEMHLPIPSLTPKAIHTNIYPENKSGTFVSIGQICNDGCWAIFDEHKVWIIKKDTGKLIIDRNRNPQDELWYFDLTKKQVNTTQHKVPQLLNYNANTKETTFQCNNVYDIKIKKDIAQYLHDAAFSPNPATWLKAIQRGFFTTWPGLDENLVQKHLEKSVAMYKGHMKQQQKNVRSTQPKNPTNKKPPQEEQPEE